MTRSTQRNEVIGVALVQAVYIGPLSFRVAAPLACRWFSPNASKPVMKSSITNFLTLPGMVILGLGQYAIRRRLLPRFKSGFCSSLKNIFSSSLFTCYKSTIFTTVMMFAFSVPRRYGFISARTILANYYHTNIIGEIQ